MIGFELNDDDPIPQRPIRAGSLVKRVHSCIVGEPECGHMQARAAIHAVADWLEQRNGAAIYWCDLLREEVK
jgi:hypothetical protein